MSIDLFVQVIVMGLWDFFIRVIFFKWLFQNRNGRDFISWAYYQLNFLFPIH